jgi:hypothetical protein
MKTLSHWVALMMVAEVSACSSLSRAEPPRPEPLFAHVGTGTFLHPLEEPETVPYPAWCQGRPYHCRKEHVYIFGVNGLNPMCLGNFNGMLDYFRKQGFTNTYFGQMYTCYWFASEIRKIRDKDPQARIVLIGFSLGANTVRSIANDLNEDDTAIDLLVYLGGDLIWDTPSSKPRNVRRVLNLRGKGIILLGGDALFNGQDIEGARNHTLKCRHILAPSRRETLTLMMEELLALACVPARPATPAPALQPAAAPPPVPAPERP